MSNDNRFRRWFIGGKWQKIRHENSPHSGVFIEYWAQVEEYHDKHHFNILGESEPTIFKAYEVLETEYYK